MISIDLSDESLFVDNTINFNDTVTFVYGRNGTGESTLSKIIKDQLLDRKVSVFQEIQISSNKKQSVKVGIFQYFSADCMGANSHEISQKTRKIVYNLNVNCMVKIIVEDYESK